MNIHDENLSAAIVLYTAYGTALSPRQDREALPDAFGPLGNNLLAEVEAILEEATTMPVDWHNHSLVSAGKMVRAKMHEMHPNLSAEALNAIEWKFTFDWR